jgi:hypothetical protein
VGIAGANGTFCGRKPSGIALIAVVDNNMVSIAKLCGSLGMLSELSHNVWRIHQSDYPIDAALGRQTSISQERLYGWTW